MRKKRHDDQNGHGYPIEEVLVRMKGNFPKGKCNSITKCETGWIVVEMLREKALLKGGGLSVANERSFYVKRKEGWAGTFIA